MFMFGGKAIILEVIVVNLMLITLEVLKFEFRRFFLFVQSKLKKRKQPILVAINYKNN